MRKMSKTSDWNSGVKMQDKDAQNDLVLRMLDADENNFFKTKMILKIYPIRFARNSSDIDVWNNPFLRFLHLQILDFIIFVYSANFITTTYETLTYTCKREKDVGNRGLPRSNPRFGINPLN